MLKRVKRVLATNLGRLFTMKKDGVDWEKLIYASGGELYIGVTFLHL